jgi:hypothetical protein
MKVRVIFHEVLSIIEQRTLSYCEVRCGCQRQAAIAQISNGYASCLSATRAALDAARRRNPRGLLG